jgi:hypothetical protein
VSDPAPRRFGRRPSKLPTEREWERAVVVEPRLAPREPELVSDGGGLPFAPAALAGATGRLDRDDPAVGALIAQIAKGTAPKRRTPWTRSAASSSEPADLKPWRLLARTDDEALFGRGRPPQLLTVAVQLDRRGAWTCKAVGAALPLRATRDGIRASRWRTDPTREPDPQDSVLRVLVTEQTFSGSQRADGRVLPPDLNDAGEELVLRMFVTPRQGFQARAPNPETPVRIALPHPVGSRRLVDGALYE